MKKTFRLVPICLLALGLLLCIPSSALADTLAITQPNGGEFLARGAEYTLEYTGYESATFDVLMSVDSGATWDYNLGQATGGSFTFTVPQVTTTNARIQISGIVGTKSFGGGIILPVWASDTSDADFSTGYLVIPIDPVIIIPVPAAPSDLEVGTDLSQFTHDLHWVDNSWNESGFKIWRRHEDSWLFALIDTVGADVTSYTDEADLTVGDTYFYRVQSYNVSGNSDYTNIAEYEVPGMIIMPLYPYAPTDLEIDNDGDPETHDLEWVDNSNNESGFKIYRKISTSLMWTLVDTIGANETSYEDESTLTIGETYNYKVLAYNGFDDSEDSNIVTYTVEDPTSDPEPAEPDTVVIDLVIGETTYEVDGVEHTMDVAPMVIDGRTLLPVRYIADPLGAGVGWVGSEQKATVTLGGTFLELWIDEPIAKINGVDTPIDAYNSEVTPIIVPPGRTMLPLRFIAEALGCQVNYYAADQSIEVIYPAP